MSATNMKIMIEKTRLTLLLVLALLLAAKAHAAAPGITGPTFNLVATPAFISQPDGATVYSWGYGCNGNPAGYYHRVLQHDAGSRSHADCHARTDGHGQFDQSASLCGRQHIDSVSWLQRDGHGRRSGTADARGGAPWYGHLHVYRFHAGHTRLLQRNARGSPSRDGPIRGNHCAALGDPWCMHIGSSC